jgi:hypothetical protein
MRFSRRANHASALMAIGLALAFAGGGPATAQAKPDVSHLFLLSLKGFHDFDLTNYVIRAGHGSEWSSRVAFVGRARTGPLRDLNPDRWENGSAGAGRVVGVVIDPSNPDRAFALSYTGGLYRTTQARSVTSDWTAWTGRWTGDRNDDGSPGPVGRGLDRGLTSFVALAMDPSNSRNMLLMANYDNRPVAKTLAGIWRSTDGGMTWNPATGGVPPCAASMNYSGGLGHLVFSPSGSGLVVAASPCRLGVSRDAGATWSWDAFPDGDPNRRVDSVAVARSGGVVFCGRSSSGAPYVAYWPGGPVLSSLQYVGPPSDPGGDCSVSVNPSNWDDVFVATHVGSGGQGTLYEGRRETFAGITWTDLKPPALGGFNGREVLVQTHVNGSQLRLFYNDDVYFYYEDCPADGRCAVPTAAPTKCAAEPAVATAWRCLEIHHADLTEIAFDPSRPDACPLLVAGDGGVTLERQCGAIKGSTLGDNGVSMSAGLHAAEPWEFAATGSVTGGPGPLGYVEGRTVGMSLQDNDTIVSNKGVTSWQTLVGVCLADGLALDMLGASGETQCNGNNVLFPDVAKPNAFSPVAAPTGAPVIADPAYFGWEGRFSDPKTFITATVASGKLQLEAYSAATGKWTAFGPATPDTMGSFGTGSSGMLAIGNRRNSTTGAVPTFWVIAPRAAPASGLRLACFVPGSGWRSSNLVNPAAVWASEGEAFWAIAYETGGTKTGVYASRNGSCTFTRDDAASTRATAGAEFNETGDAPAWRNPNLPVSAVGFDPNQPGVALIGTRHAGVVVTRSYGSSWFTSHAFPEPNGGLVGFDFANSVLPGPSGDIVLGAARGRGVWAFRVFPDVRHRAIPLHSTAVVSPNWKAPIAVECSARPLTRCDGSLAVREYRLLRGNLRPVVLGTARYSIPAGIRTRQLVQLGTAARQLPRGGRISVDVLTATRTGQEQAFARTTIVLARR